MTYACTKCRITFEVRKPRKAEWTAEFTHCATPGCDQRFWHAAGSHRCGGHESATVGIVREDIPPLEWLPA